MSVVSAPSANPRHHPSNGGGLELSSSAPTHDGAGTTWWGAVMSDITGALGDIQGNVVGGFLKDHQTFLFVHFTDSDLGRRWVRDITPSVATAREVVAFNTAFKIVADRDGHRLGAVGASWLNLAFTHSGLAALGVGGTTAPTISPGIPATRCPARAPATPTIRWAIRRWSLVGLVGIRLSSLLDAFVAPRTPGRAGHAMHFLNSTSVWAVVVVVVDVSLPRWVLGRGCVVGGVGPHG